MKTRAAGIERRRRSLVRLAVFASVVGAWAPALLGATFPANGGSLGAIPEAAGMGPAAYGSPRDVTFTVSGLTGVVGTVIVNFNATHSFVGDLQVVLKAPGGLPELALFDRTGALAPADFGSGNDLTAGFMQSFFDGSPNNWWTRALAGNPIAPGNARSVASGPTTNPPATTSLNAAFGGMSAAAANGTWTLTFRDGGAGDTGSVTAASLNIFTSAGPTLMISEFRLRGPNGANDEYIEILNNTAANHTVAAISGTGYGIAASDGVTRCSIPNGTVVPAHGHYLCVNSMGYSLAASPAGNGTTATGDATYTTDIPDNAGIALFNNDTGGGSYSMANRMDAVGSTGEAFPTYTEGGGYPSLTPFSIDYAFLRDECGKQGSVSALGVCPNGGFALDTDNNSSNFFFVDTNGTNAGAGQRLGSPGPQNLSSPVHGGGVYGEQAFDPCAGLLAPPNFVRDFTSDPANNSTFGKLDVRRTFTNNTGLPITRLRFRVIDQTTFPAPSGSADLRTRTSTSVVVTVDRSPCGSGTSNVTVQGTTLEQPPSQPNGGAFNASFSAGTVTLATPLADGASIDLRFLFGIQQTGTVKLALAAESLPLGSNALFQLSGCTDVPCPGGAKGDFNGDGLADIVFRNVAAGQQNKVWYMNAKTRTGEASISPNAASADWLIRGADDFNADGKTDLVFWNQTTGAVEFWLMNGVARSGAAVPLTGAAPLATNWDLSATADFSGDGKPDIVWRNFTSQVIAIWVMNGTVKTGAALAPTPNMAVDGNWAIVAGADFNNDNTTDLLWYNQTSGNIVTWYMNSSVVRTSGQFTTPMAAGDNNWRVVAAADFSASDMPGTPPAGSPDILWRNATSGAQVLWHLNNASTRVHGEFTDPVANSPALNWVIVGPR